MGVIDSCVRPRRKPQKNIEIERYRKVNEQVNTTLN